MVRKRQIVSLVLIIILALVDAAPAQAAAKVSSQKQYWQAFYEFTKGKQSSRVIDVSAMNIDNFTGMESPPGWNYYADIGYVISQDFDYKVTRTAKDVTYIGGFPPTSVRVNTVEFKWIDSGDRKKAKKLHKKANAINKKIIKPKMSKKQRVKAIASYLTKNVNYKYNTNTDYLFNAYGALVKKKAACQGNSAAFNLLARKAGVDSIMVTNKKENHAWNMVKIGKAYYMIDVTMPGKMGKLTKLKNLKYSIYKKYDQKKNYKKLFHYEAMVKY